jgi:hypothetical protein
MHVHSSFDAAQANARAKPVIGHIATAMEALEYMRQIVRVNANALVFDRVEQPGERSQERRRAAMPVRGRE